jgi:hypothetical protein
MGMGALLYYSFKWQRESNNIPFGNPMDLLLSGLFIFEFGSSSGKSYPTVHSEPTRFFLFRRSHESNNSHKKIAADMGRYLRIEIIL